METKDFCITESTDLPSMVSTSKAVGGVKKELEVMPLGDALEFADVAGPAPQVNGQDPSSARSN
jgi:hypothetical protein